MNNESLKDRILDDIRHGSVRMESRTRYIIALGAIGALIALIAVTTIFIWNFIAFSIRLNGHEELLWDGAQGVSFFLARFPWHLLLIDVALIALLGSLIRRFKFGYRTPVLIVVGAVAVCAVLCGFAIDRLTDMNDRFHQRPDGLPPGLDMAYRHARHMYQAGEGLCQCVVVAVGDGALLVRDEGGTTTITVRIPEGKRVPPFAVGDRILVAGDDDEGVIVPFHLAPRMAR